MMDLKTIHETAMLGSLCADFSKLTPEGQAEFLSFLDEDLREPFMLSYGFYRILTDKEYHDKIMYETMREYLQEVMQNN